jgi:hypothetical protein
MDPIASSYTLVLTSHAPLRMHACIIDQSYCFLHGAMI